MRCDFLAERRGCPYFWDTEVTLRRGAGDLSYDYFDVQEKTLSSRHGWCWEQERQQKERGGIPPPAQRKSSLTQTVFALVWICQNILIRCGTIRLLWLLLALITLVQVKLERLTGKQRQRSARPIINVCIFYTVFNGISVISVYYSNIY